MFQLSKQERPPADVRLRLCQQGQRRRDSQPQRRFFIVQRLFGHQLCELRSLMGGKKITIGTRGSKLALWQAEWVKSRLAEHHPDLEINLAVIKTRGDKILDVPLAKVGGKGLFVKEIEEALLDGRIDMAVHSMKDMPAEIPKGLRIGPVPEREDPRDVLISKSGSRFSALPAGACIGTSSLRRSAQLRYARPDIQILPLRGNLDTRLKKLETENLDAVILAAAGVVRLGLENRITQYMDPSVILPAVAQGALCIEIRENDPDVASIVTVLDHLETRRVVLGERAFLNRLGGSCQVPVAGHGHVENGRFSLTGLVADLDGTVVLRETLTGSVDESIEVGVALAEQLLDMGGKEILANLIEADNP